MAWDTEFEFDSNDSNNNFGKPINKETLKEFLTGWCICKHADLANPFEADYKMINQRVIAYSFANDSSQIIKDLTEPQKYIRLIMGVGHYIRNESHPFPFRPILQIVTKKTSDGQGEDDDTCQYEFSSPCPPCDQWNKI